MLKIRLIPVVLVKDGQVVQSKGFKRHQILGNPSAIVGRLSNWFSDELIYLDISRLHHKTAKRADLNYAFKSDFLEIIQEASRKCFMPMTVGGGVRTLEDIRQRLAHGADKVSLNTQALESPQIVTEAARTFGSQCVVVSIDYKAEAQGYSVYSNFGKNITKWCPIDWAKRVEDLGAGEILLNSIDNDGRGLGYNLEVTRQVVEAVQIPVIAMGGVGRWEHFEQCIEVAKPSGVAAANIFQYTENSVHHAKTFLYDRRFDVREPQLESLITEGEI